MDPVSYTHLLVFEMGVELVQDVLTGRTSYRQIQVFQEMASQDPAWCCLLYTSH